MINITPKTSTRRYAKAIGTLTMAPSTVALIREGKVKKGNLPEIARTAGIEAAKRTADRVIFAHPIPLDGIEIDTELLEEGVKITAEVYTVWKTGVEVEALAAVTGALLNALDMLKPHDENLAMTDIRVVDKRGGKNEFRDDFDAPIRAAVLVISDSTYAGDRQDKSGKIIRKMLEQEEVAVEVYDILPDEEDKIRARVKTLIKEGLQLVITTGGTGFGPKDVTPEAIRPLLDKTAPGIVERIRGYGNRRTPYAMLSREVAGIAGESLVITLPGSSSGARESMHALFPGLLHLFRMMWGGGHRPPETPNREEQRL